MKKVYLVKCLNCKEGNGFIDQVFSNLEEAQKYIKIQNEYWESTNDQKWIYYLNDTKPLRTKAIISEEPTEETE